VDAGLSRREIAKRLAAIGEDVHKLDAILITHEHSDHVAGLGSLARALRIPIYLTGRTVPFIDWGEPELEAKRKATVESFQAGCGFTVGEFDISSFTIPHDAIDPVGFTFKAHGVRVSIATDLGYMPDSIRMHLRGTDVLLLESNHDLEMLKVGPYPWSVKQRVMGRRGHLSNEVTGKFLKNDLDSSVSTLILGHISEHNNHPELVRRMAMKSLDGRLLFTRLMVAEPGCQSEVITY
jgi:phosphoribosyl 1,2-cyclic phosphodiesterase